MANGLYGLRPRLCFVPGYRELERIVRQPFDYFLESISKLPGSGYALGGVPVHGFIEVFLGSFEQFDIIGHV